MEEKLLTYFLLVTRFFFDRVQVQYYKEVLIFDFFVKSVQVNKTINFLKITLIHIGYFCLIKQI